MKRVIIDNVDDIYLVIENEAEDIFGLNFISLDKYRQQEVIDFTQKQMDLMEIDYLRFSEFQSDLDKTKI